jgi:D-methionine transport system permease protein
MSFLKYPFWEVFVHSFSSEVWADVLPSIWETLYMTIVSSAIMLVGGLLIGLILMLTNPNGLIPVKPVHAVVGTIINALRSLPEMIMIILMIPVAQLLFGQSYGTSSCIIAISACLIPFYARIVESSLLDIDRGVVDAAKSMGSTNAQIIFNVVIPETFPSLIRGFTTAVISVISMTALSGMFGAGGLGDIAVRFGYQRFEHDVLLAAVYALLVLVSLVQLVGNGLSHRELRRRALV